jgi:hypothetical protein
VTREIDELPVPVVNDQPARACVTYNWTENRWQISWMIGTEKLPTDLRFDHPGKAAAAARQINERSGQ